MNAPSSIAVVVISKGRPAVLKETLQGLARQTLKPAKVIAVVTCDDDFPPEDRPDFVEVYTAKASTCIQRNRGLENVPPDIDYVAYIDDDMELKDDYLEEAVRFLNQCPGVVAICAQLLRDGGVSREQARELISDYEPVELYEGAFDRHENSAILYGCCMTIRRSILKYEQFDENLPLYAYAEDYDLSIRLRRYGIIGRYKGCVAVHLKTAGGRVNEVQRGYAIIANCWYLLQKDVSHLSPVKALLRFWLVVFIKQQFLILLKILRGDRSLNWWGQACGCFAAVGDILRGRCSPRRMLDWSK